MIDSEEFKIKTSFEVTNFYKHQQMLFTVHGKAITVNKKEMEKIKRAFDQIYEDTCLDHPTYKAVRKPTSKCPKCLYMYMNRKKK